MDPVIYLKRDRDGFSGIDWYFGQPSRIAPFEDVPGK